MTPATAPIEFDPADEALAQDPFPTFKEIRATCPIARSEKAGGFWFISRYEDIRFITLHPEIFSSACTNIPRDVGFGEGIVLPPLNLDPPAHTVSKQRMTSHFLPAEMPRYADGVRRQIGDLLDALVAKGSFDVSTEFAALVATSTLCDVVGLPHDHDLIISWLHRFFGEDMEAAHAGVAEALMFLMAALESARTDPKGDLLSRLAVPDPDGTQIDDMEIMSTALIVTFAGIETTWSTLTSGIHYLATHPDQQQRLRDDPSLIESAREEFLRAFGPVSPARLVVEDVELNGQQISKGDMVWLSLPSANRDEDVFDDPDEVVLDRGPNRHLAFGTGVHRCLGVNVARLELSIALEELLQRVPPFHLAHPDQVRWSTGVTRSAKGVVIEFDREGS